MFTQAFESAINHAMIYEVGGFWRLTPDVADGLINTPAQRKACGYTNDPTDRGGETKFGIAKSANPELNISKLTFEDAKAVYYRKYWLVAKCDKLLGRLAALQFDGATNMGPKTATKMIQRSIGVLDDGIIGSMTLSAILMFDEFTLCKMVCNNRANYYKAIVANDRSQGKYINGWLRRVDEMLAFVTNPNIEF